MSTVAELVAQLKELPKDDVVKALQSGAHDVWQDVYNAGHANATARGADATKTKDDELKAALAAQTKAETQLESLQKSQPDLAKVREQYDTEIAELKTKHTDELQSESNKRVESETKRAGGDLRSQMVALGVDPDFADVVADKPNVKSRISFVDGAVVVMQAGKDIPIHAAEGQTAIGVFAEELTGAVPAKFKNSNADKGSGMHRSGSNSSSGNQYDQLREDAKARREQAQPAGKTAAEKLRMTSAAG